MGAHQGRDAGGELRRDIAHEDRHVLDPAIGGAVGDDPRVRGVFERHRRFRDALERGGGRERVGQDLLSRNAEQRQPCRGALRRGGGNHGRQQATKLRECQRGSGQRRQRCPFGGLRHQVDRDRVCQAAQLGRVQQGGRQAKRHRAHFLRIAAGSLQDGAMQDCGRAHGREQQNRRRSRALREF